MNVSISVEQASLEKTLRKLRDIPERAARKALRRGVSKGGTLALQAARATAPKGLTGLFRRSLAKREKTYSSVFVSIVGQRARGKAFNAKTVALANKRTGALSKGLSGRGLPPSIAWIEKGTKPHAIRSRKWMAWTVTKGGSRRTKPLYSRSVRHPGHRARPMLLDAARRTQPQRLAAIRNEVERELMKG